MTSEQVLRAIKAGQSPVEIAIEHGVSRQTVHGHVSRLRRLGELPTLAGSKKRTRISADIEGDLAAAFVEEAERRGQSTMRLARLLLEAIITDNLYNAVLED